MYGLSHRVAHDLESVFYVLLFICTHLGGPRNTVGNPPLYGGATACKHPSAIKQWLCANNLNALAHLKFSHMVGHFEDVVLPYISPYFQPLRQHLSLLWATILPHRSIKPTVGKEALRSDVTCSNIIEAFKLILRDKSLISQAEQAGTTLGKRSLPGDLDVAQNGWDAVRAPKKLLITDPKVKPNTKRQAKLMTKGRKGT
jgi:hypothetical protein